MVSETGNSAKFNGLNKPNEEIFEKKRKSIETYSIIAIFILISAALLIIFQSQTSGRLHDNCRRMPDLI